MNTHDRNAAAKAHGHTEAEWRCKACGSHRSVRISTDQGNSFRWQCVPCGKIDPQTIEPSTPNPSTSRILTGDVPSLGPVCERLDRYVNALRGRRVPVCEEHVREGVLEDCEDCDALMAMAVADAEQAEAWKWVDAASEAAERRLDQSIKWMERAEAAEAEVERLRAEVESWKDTTRLAMRALTSSRDVLHEASGLPEDVDDPDVVDETVLALRPRAEKAEAEVERLLAEIRDRESERADLRDRVTKAEAKVARIEELADRCERWGEEAIDSQNREWLPTFAATIRTALEEPKP